MYKKILFIIFFSAWALPTNAMAFQFLAQNPDHDPVRSVATSSFITVGRICDRAPDNLHEYKFLYKKDGSGCGGQAVYIKKELFNFLPYISLLIFSTLLISLLIFSKWRKSKSPRVKS